MGSKCLQRLAPPWRRIQSEDEDNVFAGYRGKLKIGILPVSTFASGHTYFVTRMYEKVKQELHVIHATFTLRHGRKAHRLREALVWSDPPEYYDPPGGLLSYVADIPEDLLRHSGLVEGHFALVNHQLLQVRAAPRSRRNLSALCDAGCTADSTDGGHPTVANPDPHELPYLCPMDHVFEIESWVREEPDVEFDPALTFGSTVNNSALSEAVNSSTWNSWRVVNMGSARKRVAAAPKDTKIIVANTSSRTSMSRSCSALIKTPR